jgi:hypothetical protein
VAALGTLTSNHMEQRATVGNGGGSGGSLPQGGTQDPLGCSNGMMAAWNDGDGSRTTLGKRLGEGRAKRPRKGEAEAGSRCIALRQSSPWQQRRQGLNDDDRTTFTTSAALLRAEWENRQGECK